MRYSFTLRSENRKTGPMPVTMTSADSCPSSCPLNGHGCYAQHGPLSWVWRKVTSQERGLTLSQLCKRIRELPAGTVWRHNVAGDLPGKGERIAWFRGLWPLAKANKGRRGFTFTHKEVVPSSPRPPKGQWSKARRIFDNGIFIWYANREGFTINLSADSLTEADRMAALNIAPVVTLLPGKLHLPLLDGVRRKSPDIRTPQGRRVVVCPAYTHADQGVTCATCKLCAWPKRKVIIGFPAHGTGRKKAELVQLGGAGREEKLTC